MRCPPRLMPPCYLSPLFSAVFKSPGFTGVRPVSPGWYISLNRPPQAGISASAVCGGSICSVLGRFSKKWNIFRHMHIMKHTAILGLVIGWLAGYSAMGKEVFREDFEKDDPSHGVPAAEAPGKPGEKETPSAQKVAGARALPYYDTQIVHGGKRSLCTMWCNKGLPNATQGVFTLWSYDNMSESAWRSLNVTFMGVVDGKPGTVNAHLSQISSVP